MTDMNTMPVPDLINVLREKAKGTDDILLAITLNVLANRLYESHHRIEIIKTALLNEPGLPHARISQIIEETGDSKPA